MNKPPHPHPSPPVQADAGPNGPDPASARQVFKEFLRLGLTAFGGPVAHLGFFRRRFVQELGWLDDRRYADLVALCQLLPGPASSQVGMGLGLMRAGRKGALAAWLGFTMPSALAMALLGWGLAHGQAGVPQVGLHGLKLAAAAVVTQALWGMVRSLCPDWPRRLAAMATAFVLWLRPEAGMQLVALVTAGMVWGLWMPTPPALPSAGLRVPISRTEGLAWWGLLAVLLVGLPLAMAWSPSLPLAVVDVFVRVGALVFGGGHVVLPLLQAEVVPNGWVAEATFVAGYGAVQAMPGPLFTFAAYIGAALAPLTQPAAGGGLTSLVWAMGWACLALVAVFGPAWLTLAGALPHWEHWKSNSFAMKAISGINAAVVGLLAAAWLNPVLPAAVQHASDLVWLMALLALLQRTRTPPWAVVLLACALGWISQLMQAG